MVEVWLRPNRRVIVAASLIPLASLLLAVLIAWQAAHRSRPLGMYVLAAILAAVGVLLLLLLAFHWRQPRIAFRDGHVLFYLCSGKPIATPLELVEAFFVGQGPAMLGGRDGEELQSVNLVARISRRAAQWQQVPVNPRLGHWCDGYVTIRGTWCEPLTEERVLQLNQRLDAVRRQATAQGNKRR